MRVATRRSPGVGAIRWLILAFMLAFMPVACGGGPTDPTPDPGPGPAPDTNVASTTVSAPATSVQAGGSVQLTAVAKNAAGQTLSGKSFTWSTSDKALAEVSTAGLVTAHAAGTVTITATETGSGKAGSVALTITAAPVPETPVAARVTIAPRFAAIPTGGQTPLAVEAFAASGQKIAAPAIAWESGAAQQATVDATGTVRGVAAGVASISARVDAASDTAWVAVLGAKDLLATAFAGGGALTEARPGDTLQVAVALDLSRIGADGDLGSAQFDLRYDDSLLVYKSAQAGVSGGASQNLAAPGLFKFSFASTATQGRAELTLVTVTFQVAQSAPAGEQSAFTLDFTAAPTGTGFQPYARPITVGGRLRVVAP